MRVLSKLQMARASLLLLILVSAVFAATPSTMNYQGSLKDGSGDPVADGPYFVTFRIYSVPTAGAALWADTQTVVTLGGLFQATLGAGTPLEPTVFADTPRYLGVTVFPDGEMSPRQKIHAVAYAWRVATVDGATGGTISGDVTIQSDLDVSGTVTATGQSSKIRFQYDTYGDLPDPTAYHGMFAHVHALGRAYFAHAGAWVPLADSAHGHNSLMAADGVPGQAVFVDSVGLVGIGTTSPKASLEINGDLIRTVSRAHGYGNELGDVGPLPSRILVFNKKRADTGVRVTWTDNMRVLGASGGRWEIRFNGAACGVPGALVYDYYEPTTGATFHQSQTVCGTCFGLAAGVTTIQIYVGPAPGYGATDLYTGWNSSYWAIEAEEVR